MREARSGLARVGLAERARIAAVRAQRLRRTSASVLLALSFQRWQWRPASDLGYVPQELRMIDESFWPELQGGHFGLPGATVELDGYSPFEIAPPSTVWDHELHGFGWLRHLTANSDPAAHLAARGFVLDWMTRKTVVGSRADQPHVRGRRVLSWIAHAPVLLDEADVATARKFVRGLSREVAKLAATWRNAGEGEARLMALTGLVAAKLALEGQASPRGQRALEAMLETFCGEIERQILTDGGHVSRNPAVLVELLLDWLPLRSCFVAAHIDVPSVFGSSIARMQTMVRFLRLGDGGLPRFNGMTVADAAGLATLLAYDEGSASDCHFMPQSKYARLERQGLIVLIDAGGPPPLMVSGDAHAGCLSMEVSMGSRLVFVNCGAPVPCDAAWRATSRATASHTTACLGELSSAQLMRHDGLESLVGGVPMQALGTVKANVSIEDAQAVFEGSHGGYRQRLGLEHRRRVAVQGDGLALSGSDWIGTEGGDGRLKRDVPFAIHFHLHPTTSCVIVHGAPGAETSSCEITLAGGEHLRFEATGAQLDVEESLFFGFSSGPRPSLQIVLRGACMGESMVLWSLTGERQVAKNRFSSQRSFRADDVTIQTDLNAGTEPQDSVVSQ
jgi:uncharacterized heparinase superfamily protein